MAVNVVDQGDHVSYETDAGVLSLPKSIVARIDRDAAIPQPAAGWKPAVEAPQANPAEGFAEIVKATVRDGSIDFAYLARLENAANGGDRGAVAKVSAAHHVAAQYLLSKGDLEGAMDHYRRALTYAPDQLGLLVHLADLQLRRSEFTAALDTLDHARRVSPSSADVAKLSGWGYYSTNRLEKAVEEWKLALELRPDPDVQRALDKALRDQETESDYREGRTQHFNLKYYGGAAPELARETLRTLEEHFRAIESVLGFSPPDSVSVILYTDQDFADITRAPGWAGAINDGRIRVPVKGLTNVTPDFSRILKHELTHTFIQQKTRGRCPVWLQEGTAQWMEGRRSGDAAAGLLSVYQNQQNIPLAALEGSWLNFSGQSASLAYAWSLAVVESIVASGGEGDLNKLLVELPGAPSMEAALRGTLHMSYADLEEQTAGYLKKQYLR